MNIKSLSDKMDDKNFAVNNCTEGWPKDSKETIGYLYSHSLIPLTKDCYFSKKKYEYCVNLLNE